MARLKALWRLVMASLLPDWTTDWHLPKRKGAVVFLGEVWYALPLAAGWMTLNRYGLLQCWMTKPRYSPGDGCWYGVEQPLDLGSMASEWYLPKLIERGGAQNCIEALPEDIYDT